MKVSTGKIHTIMKTKNIRSFVFICYPSITFSVETPHGLHHKFMVSDSSQRRKYFFIQNHRFDSYRDSPVWAKC